MKYKKQKNHMSKTSIINNALKVSSKSIMKRRFNSVPKNDHVSSKMYCIDIIYSADWVHHVHVMNIVLNIVLL